MPAKTHARPTYCITCGMPKWSNALRGCRLCGGAAFTTSLRALSWELLLTWNDKTFLHHLGIDWK